MDLLALGKEVAQSALERAASYRPGQAALRHADRALWVLEKSARWAVPPPLDSDEAPQPELVRPLPWLAFLPLLLALRVAREAVSLLNLLLGKPPLRSADVVTYIQGKRRHLRTVKYAGGRLSRARAGRGGAWAARLRHLLDLTMCFRSAASHAPADQVMIVHRKQTEGGSDMERLIEKMMADVGAKTDDDDDDDDDEDNTSYTLTNATSVKSDSELESEQDRTPPRRAAPSPPTPPAATPRAATPPAPTPPAATPRDPHPDPHPDPLPNNNHAMEDRNNTEQRSNGDAAAAADARPADADKSAIPQPVDRKNKDPKDNHQKKRSPKLANGRVTDNSPNKKKEAVRT